MKIYELIDQLKKHPNQNADIEVIANIKNADDEDEDIILNNIEVWDIDSFVSNYVTIFASLKN